MSQRLLFFVTGNLTPKTFFTSNFFRHAGGILFAASLFDMALQFGFLEFKPQSNNLWLLRRGPGGILRQ
jgi:hypothetical protein